MPTADPLKREAPDSLMLTGFSYRALPSDRVKRGHLHKAMLLDIPLVIGRDLLPAVAFHWYERGCFNCGSTATKNPPTFARLVLVIAGGCIWDGSYGKPGVMVSFTP